MKSRVRFFIQLLLFVNVIPVYSQHYDYPFQNEFYDFIRYDLNRITFFGDSSKFTNLFLKYDDLILRGTGKLNIVHIGGSHIQADIYSNRMRQRLQTFQPGLNGGRGFVFPYTIAGTNNPANYRVTCNGIWESCRNVETRRDCLLGLSGISVTTFDTTASVTLKLRPDSLISYDFNTVKVFHDEDSSTFQLSVSSAARVIGMDYNGELGFTTYYLDDYVDSLFLSFVKTDSLKERFVLYGLSLENDDPGVVYHAIGINGAKIPSFLRCSLLGNHLKALDPDLVIISLGTNDAAIRNFDKEKYRLEYDSLLTLIINALPETALLLTVPNDSYLYRRYINNNTAKVKEVIESLARQYHCGVWNLYSIMGGLNSIVTWQEWGLAKRDRIHFTVEGYHLVGDLFFDAFLKSYDSHLNERK